ncbi:MAG: ABC transporter substrate-binding protein [Helicobacteraceae bacterium]|nr:ABC transporter substrate-binding protein [Helicobacteraceae bacterium]
MKKQILIFLIIAFPLFAQKEAVSVQLQWLDQFQFAGFYIAKEKGFYDEVGLDVTLKAYAPGIDTVDEVVSQRSQYALGRSSLLLERAKGTPVVALAAIFQSSPSVLIATDPKIKTPRELNGKRIMVTSDEVESAAIMGMLLANGIRPDEVALQNHSMNYRDLIDSKTDAMSCYLSNEPYLLQEAKADFTVFDPKEYGFNFYGDLLFTSEEEIENHPKRVEKFYAATVKGWLWAFDHIEESAALIYEKYNSQHKSFASLVYEGETLKKLAMEKNVQFGSISKIRYEKIVEAYRLSGLLPYLVDLNAFINPMGLGKQKIKIGVLANRPKIDIRMRWEALLAYANEVLPQYSFEMVPLAFGKLEEVIRNGDVDFLFANTMLYVHYENHYGLTRIATLLNLNMAEGEGLKRYGGVIFTRSDNKDINSLQDLKGRRFGAVVEESFGGWVMAYEALLERDIDRSDIDLHFLGTQDAVVNAVLNGEVDAGTVRTDILERMVYEKRIDLSSFKVLSPRAYEGFPYLVSTKLYPEWPLAKLKHTPDRVAYDILGMLIKLTPTDKIAKRTQIAGWTIPLDYSDVHKTLKALRLPPYDRTDLTVEEVFDVYGMWIYLFLGIFIVITASILYVRHTNTLLTAYNRMLDDTVKVRTQDLEKANKALKILSRTDPLTKIHNRHYFMNQAEKYLDIAQRNRTPLQILMLDLDYFKNINDTYGHPVGDQVLQCFTKAVSERLRKSDLFGRIGGEEFAICLQNSSAEGAIEFAEELCTTVATSACSYDEENTINFTVSIGMVSFTDDKGLPELLSKADEALYKSKRSGRNQVSVYRS